MTLRPDGVRPATRADRPPQASDLSPGTCWTHCRVLVSGDHPVQLCGHAPRRPPTSPMGPHASLSTKIAELLFAFCLMTGVGP